MISTFFAWLFNLLLKDAFLIIQSWTQQWLEQRKQQSIADQNVKKDDADMKTGDLHEVEKGAENLLNGDKP